MSKFATGRLRDEIRKVAKVTSDAEGELVVARMEHLVEAVRIWDKMRRERAKNFRRQALAQKFR